MRNCLVFSTPVSPSNNLGIPRLQTIPRCLGLLKLVFPQSPYCDRWIYRQSPGIERREKEALKAMLLQFAQGLEQEFKRSSVEGLDDVQMLPDKVRQPFSSTLDTGLLCKPSLRPDNQ
jgi:hypothetical protein